MKKTKYKENEDIYLQCCIECDKLLKVNTKFSGYVICKSCYNRLKGGIKK